MYANANLSLRKFSRCSVNVKCYLFKTYCSNLYCAPMWFDCTKTVLTKLKVAYNNSLRRFMGLPWLNSASEMFVNLNINHLVNCFKFLYTVFVQGLLYLGILCCQVFVKIHVVFIQSYGLGGEHYCMAICDRPHTYYSLRNS